MKIKKLKIKTQYNSQKILKNYLYLVETLYLHLPITTVML